MIEISNITKSFGEQRVLTDVSTVFEAGKTNLVIGISGSGKTVLMKIMTGLMTPITKLVLPASNKEKLDRVNFCLERVNLAGANKKFPGEISGGMKKRVGIARAIVLNPKYLFCDEPNSGLDPRTSIVIDDLIIEITREFNMTTIINTHDMNSVMEIGEKIAFLYKGVKDWEGDKSQILDVTDENLNSFIFASDFLKDARDALKEKIARNK